MLKLLLASSSPRRLALLQGAGVDVVVRPPGCDERVLPQERAVEHARRLAKQKLMAVSDAMDAEPTELSGRDILAADTVVWTGDGTTMFGKPESAAQARTMLAQLATGTSHWVTTAWALGRGPDAFEVHETTTRVFMRALATDETEAYLRSDEWTDKAGGYAIQGRAAGWIRRIEGSYTNVVGLPLCAVLERLIARGGEDTGR